MRVTRVLPLFLALLLSGAAIADVPGVMTYQGYLTAAGGEPIDGPVDLSFQIYGQPTGGGSVWGETIANVPVAGGLFSVVLGLDTPLTADVFATPELYLGITVEGGSEMTPRQRLGSVPWALEAFRASQADDAAALDGRPASAYADADHTHPPAAGLAGVDFARNDTQQILSTIAVDVTSVELDAPAAGFIQVTMQGQFQANVNENDVTCEASISETSATVNTDEQVTWTTYSSGKDFFSRIALFEVPTAGTYTYYFTARKNGWDGSCYLRQSTIAALFVPNRY